MMKRLDPGSPRWKITSSFEYQRRRKQAASARCSLGGKSANSRTRFKIEVVVIDTPEGRGQSDARIVAAQ
jgi:hypothetical protein